MGFIILFSHIHKMYFDIIQFPLFFLIPPLYVIILIYLLSFPSQSTSTFIFIRLVYRNMNISPVTIPLKRMSFPSLATINCIQILREGQAFQSNPFSNCFFRTYLGKGLMVTMMFFNFGLCWLSLDQNRMSPQIY